ncbi:peptidase inhibitor R3HDML-like isoform X1 [Centruroides vittatus]|uniref:peptidase inhibitor R3HDML-like isoform X1 n=1 Tax=Centruroides vittatus TaxID=120091 RepID=UPI00350F1E69
MVEDIFISWIWPIVFIQIINPIEGIAIKKNNSKTNALQDKEKIKYSGFNQIEEEDILNEFYSAKDTWSGYNISNLVKPVWNDELAKLAKDWGDHCTMKFGPSTCNNFYNQSRGVFSNSYEDLFKSWKSQKFFYDHLNNSCTGPCDEYKLMMWAEAYAIGCSKSSCENLGYKYLMVCNFYPPMDMNMPPFKMGKLCSNCPTNFTCNQEMICDKRSKVVPKETFECIKIESSSMPTSGFGRQYEIQKNILLNAGLLLLSVLY